MLFPGDAQIENWSYALSTPAIKKLLSKVNVYKVGHHGGRNATLKTLWPGFKNRSTKKTDKGRLKSIMSTMPGKHGNAASNAEVPRKTLVEALESQSLKGKETFRSSATLVLEAAVALVETLICSVERSSNALFEAKYSP